ncbi:MAG TPA: hypothetical protein VG456_13690 [Candidatus Sulfopaludibacter sp.]|nr:hypothetical protein [Candidatus Sulfopaludibacter sp.]
MVKALKQVRAAFSLLSPDDIRALSLKPVRFGLVAVSDSGYEEMEEFLSPTQPSQVFRAGSSDAPGDVDLVLYQQQLAAPSGTYTYWPNDQEATIAAILSGNDDIHLALARQFPVFRKQVIDRLIHTIARENALFAVATALPDVVPNLMELPWVFGEWASDTAFLTANQIRMAFLIAAACDKEIGFSHQKAEALTIGASAFGWRAIARELVGKIPLGGGLIPKGAIAYAGTYVMGKGLERLHHASLPLTRDESRGVYSAAFERGKNVVQALVK